jgi:hypothetical protein
MFCLLCSIYIHIYTIHYLNPCYSYTITHILHSSKHAAYQTTSIMYWLNQYLHKPYHRDLKLQTTNLNLIRT